MSEPREQDSQLPTGVRIALNHMLEAAYAQGIIVVGVALMQEGRDLKVELVYPGNLKPDARSDIFTVASDTFANAAEFYATGFTETLPIVGRGD